MSGLLACFLAAVLAANAQDLAGVIDIHAHCDPDSMPRSIDGLALARLAEQRGMRGIVLKNHFESTASLAWLARRRAPRLETFGGIALNLPVGGINPAAVEHMVRVKGGYGRVVWMPTFDAENQVRVSGEKRPFVPVARNGRLVPEAGRVLDLIAKYKLVLATGHSSPEEDLLLVREARARGIEHIVVTHATVTPVNMSAAQMKQAAALGAYIEFCYNALIGANRVSDIGAYAKAIRGVGARHCIVSSDLGQAGNPLHPDGFLTFLGELRAQGFTREEIDAMSKENPARLLGLAERAHP